MAKMNVFPFVILLLKSLDFAQSIACDGQPKNKETELKEKLFCSYDKEERPIVNFKNATIVKIMMFIQTFDYYETYGTITLNSWVGMRWKDEHLKWNKEDYDGIDTLTVHSDDIWKPDLATYHHESTQYDESCSPSHCILYNDGTVSCIPPCSHSGNCEADYRNWPFDVQQCKIHLGSWMHKGSEIRFIAAKVTMEEKAKQHNEWKITSIKTRNLKGNYSCCPDETYPSISYLITIARHSAAESIFIVSPAIILAVLNLVALWLNPSCSERILLNVIGMFAHFIFLQQLSWLIPRNGQTAPNALIYFRDSMVIAAILLLDTIIKRGLLCLKSDTPAWIKSTTNTLRGNRIGQLMFTNPYLITKVTLDNEATPAEDFDNLVEGGGGGQPSTESATANSKNEPNNIWYVAVRVLDTLMFLVLTLTYFVMIFGWIPMSDTTPKEKPNIVIVSDDE